MPVVFLREDDVTRLADMPMAIGAVERAFLALANGAAHDVPRVRARGKGIVLHGMSAADDEAGYVGWKQYTSTSSGARFLVGLYRSDSGELVALMEADFLGRLRTGAATGLAVRCLADPAAEEMALVGCGRQAATQLEAVATVRSLRRAFIYCRDATRREAFAAEMSARLELEVVPCESAEAAVTGRPIVVTATTSSAPVCHGAWLAPGSVTCAVGSNWLRKAELDVQAVETADRIVCDSIEACRREAGDFVAALETRTFDWGQAEELSAVVKRAHEQANGSALPLDRHSETDRVLFKSVGLAIEDVALAVEILKQVEL